MHMEWSHKPSTDKNIIILQQKQIMTINIVTETNML